ncbi:MAG: hypothetical protein NTY77_11820 [Elusimicrobia bacterium]|nr:hypothetical protein [Elusimicrobiota bacterium]
MNTKLLTVLSLICASAPLSAQTRFAAFGDIRFSDIKAALAPSAAVLYEPSAIDGLAAALSDPRATPAAKLQALQKIKSDDLYHFEDWAGGLAPQAEMQVVFSIKDIYYSSASAGDRYLAVAVCGRFARRFKYSAAASDAVDFLKDLALRNDPNGPGQGQTIQAVFGLAEIAKAAPLKDLDFRFTERTVGSALDVLERYGTGGISDRVSQEQLYGLLILSNYLAYHLDHNALGNHVGGYADRVDLMPAWPGNLAWRMQGVLIDPAERDLERLYTPSNTDYRGYLAATLIDLARVTSMDYGTIEHSRRLLRNMANHDEPVPAIRWMLAPYRR